MSQHWQTHPADAGAMKEGLHIVPTYPGERQHTRSPRCWCSPSDAGVIEGHIHDGVRVWSHHRKAGEA